MALNDLIILLVIIAVGIQFWQIRAKTEMANRFAANYCKQHQLQLLSVARASTRISWYKAKLVWKCQFQFEFSANRESLNKGSFVMQGKTVTSMDVAAYPIN